ncbi:hypothetical protein AB1A81_01995 [Bdellovibrio bacteriovorus]|uniref:hypothetical protein n=1 Tax=Bdellovibrio bacteriovorus TaxID=959 RepID=UPI0002FDAD1F|nr:hypothetical protein [Bdellovibrio bacteriovorus]AHZ86049.1 hypothetical protein EP01_14070 [Bdellovibrio bacteriovorus]BEV66974.1 hypothetical protein Bb109J_c0394 [Bdellovibrio bacteriovorus]
MTFTKIITAAIITMSATASFGATKCTDKANMGRHAHTASQSKFSPTVKVVKTATNSGIQ